MNVLEALLAVGSSQQREGVGKLGSKERRAMPQRI